MKFGFHSDSASKTKQIYANGLLLGLEGD